MGDLSRNFTLEQGPVYGTAAVHGWFDGLTIKALAVTESKLAADAVSLDKIKSVETSVDFAGVTVSASSSNSYTISLPGCAADSYVTCHGYTNTGWSSILITVSPGSGEVYITLRNLTTSDVTFGSGNPLQLLVILR